MTASVTSPTPSGGHVGKSLTVVFACDSERIRSRAHPGDGERFEVVTNAVGATCAGMCPAIHGRGVRQHQLFSRLDPGEIPCRLNHIGPRVHQLYCHQAIGRHGHRRIRNIQGKSRRVESGGGLSGRLHLLILEDHLPLNFSTDFAITATARAFTVDSSFYFSFAPCKASSRRQDRTEQDFLYVH